MSSRSADYTTATVLFAVCAIATIIVLFVVFNKQDPLTTGVFVPGINCTLLTCPAGLPGPPGIGIPGPPGAQGPQG